MIAQSNLQQGEFIFPQGIAGFQDAHRFGFIYEGHGDMTCMQCIDHPEAAFILTPWDTERLQSPPTLSEDHLTCLQGSSQAPVDYAHLMWMLVLNPFADQQWVTANLKAPIILNLETRRGIQYIRHNTGLNLRFPWAPQPQLAASSA